MAVRLTVGTLTLDEFDRLGGKKTLQFHSAPLHCNQPTDRTMTRLTLTALMLGAMAVAGCDTMSETLNKRPPVDVAQPTSLRPQVVAIAPVSNGSIFQAGQYRPLFEDHRARLVGDSLTVQIVEKVSASQIGRASCRERVCT